MIWERKHEMFSKLCATINTIFTTNPNTKDTTCLWDKDYTPTPTTTPYYNITIRPLNVVQDDIAEECARG